MIKQDFCDLILLCFNKGVLKKLVFSRPKTSSAEKISGRLCSHRGQKILAFELSLPGNTVSQRNLYEKDIKEAVSVYLDEYRQCNLITTVSDAEYKLSKKGEEVFLGADKLLVRLTRNNDDFACAIEALDRRKSYLLSGAEEFLIRLGISDKNGRVHDKKQGKFRQINKFLEYVENIYPTLGDKGTLTVYDLCCGKSYLSFALYYYLTAMRGRAVNMLGIDLKRDVIDYCRDMAQSLGFSGMKFITDNIENTPADVSVDLVVSLHACDIATDIVLDTAVRLGAKVILSTPCCHKNLSDKINDESLSFVTKYPKLKGKLCEAVTDALRLERLRAFGYDATATELVDPEDTPKNTLLRAIKVSDYSEEEYKRYLATLKMLMGDGYKGYLKNL